MSSWCELGLAPGDFFAQTLREFDVITGARIKAKDAEINARRVLQQELGVLISHAFHSPKSMPDFTRAAQKPRGDKPRDRAAEVARAQACFVGLHMQSKAKEA